MSLLNRVPTPLLLTSVGHMVLEFSNNFLPVLYPLLMPALGLNFAQVGFIALIASTVLSLTQPFFGYVSDRWRATPIVAVAILWTGTAMGLVGFSNSYIVLLILVALGSLGSAAFHPPATVIAAANSGEKRGSGLSVFSVGGNVGTALSPLWMVVALGFAGLAGTISVPIFSLIFSLIFFSKMRSYTAVRRSGKEAETPDIMNGFILGMILIIGATMFRSWYQVAFMTYLPAWIEGSGGTLAAGSRMLAIFLFSISIGSVVGGVSGDRFGHLVVLIAAMILLPIFHWGFMSTSGLTQMLAILLCGVAVGSSFPTSIVLVLDSWPRQAGVASGLLMGLGWWPGGLGASLTGLLADRTTLTSALWTLTFVPLFGLVCLFLYSIAERTRKRKLSEQVV